MEFFCSVSYNGFWAPSMQWIQITEEYTSALAIPVKEYATEDFEKVSTINLSLVINSSTKGSSYSCRTYFVNISSTHSSTTASNIPSYESMWTSTAIEMYCKYRSLEF